MDRGWRREAARWGRARERAPVEVRAMRRHAALALTFERQVMTICGRGKVIMIKRLGVLILAATLLAACTPAESVPQKQTSITTTVTCPAGQTLQSDGMCR
jgi:hypothetical protein